MASFDTDRNKLPVGSSPEFARGFSLVELMITLTILGILAAIAIPSYTQRAIVAKRTDATTSLLAIAAAQEKFYLKNSVYSDDLDDLSLKNTEANLYDLSLTMPDGGGFIATATAADGASQENDEQCFSLSIDHTGRKSSTSNEDGDESVGCW